MSNNAFEGQKSKTQVKWWRPFFSKTGGNTFNREIMLFQDKACTQNWQVQVQFQVVRYFSIKPSLTNWWNFSRSSSFRLSFHPCERLDIDIKSGGIVMAVDPPHIEGKAYVDMSPLAPLLAIRMDVLEGWATTNSSAWGLSSPTW